MKGKNGIDNMYLEINTFYAIDIQEFVQVESEGF
jgi:hypothetical protein